MKLSKTAMARTAVGVGIVLATPFVVGSLLPRDHVADGVRELPYPAGEVFWRAVDIDGWSEWRTTVDSVEHIEGSHFEAVVHGAGESIRYGFDLDVEGRTMSADILDVALPYGGRWTITILDRGGSTTEVRVTEEGFVDPPLWRFVSHVIIGTETTLNRYLDDLVATCHAGHCGPSGPGAG